MHKVKRVFGGFGVYDANDTDDEIIIEKFTGAWAKKKAEARAAILNGTAPVAQDSQACEKSGRGLRGRGGAYRGQ
jgi:hypothetical protein